MIPISGTRACETAVPMASPTQTKVERETCLTRSAAIVSRPGKPEPRREEQAQGLHHDTEEDSEPGGAQERRHEVVGGGLRRDVGGLLRLLHKQPSRSRLARFCPERRGAWLGLPLEEHPQSKDLARREETG